MKIRLTFRILVLSSLLVASASWARSPSARNLLLPIHGAVFSGSLGALITPAFLEGRAPLKQIRIPPQTLIVEWPHPVTFSEQIIEWKDASVYATHYGLERWDADQKRYVLIYEEPSNTQARSVHTFPPVTTLRVRWTVFAHPLNYDSIILRAFQLQ